MFLIAKTPLLLQSLKLPVHADVRDQCQDALGQTLGHQLVCEARRETHQLITGDKIKMRESTERLRYPAEVRIEISCYKYLPKVQGEGLAVP